MLKRVITAAALAAVLASAADSVGLAEAATAPCGNASSVRAKAEALTSIGPRPDSSPAAARAVAIIREQLAALDLIVEREPIGTIVVPAVELGPWQLRIKRKVKSSSDNVWVRFGGEGPARLLIAHYDTVRASPGAIDNAIAVAILLELAGCLASGTATGPVIIAFVGAEEVGLAGARRLAQTLTGELELAVSLDLIGHQEKLALNGVGRLWTRQRLEWLAARVRAAQANASVPLAQRLISRKFPQLERSDHGAFSSIPALHLYGRDSDRIFLAYHTEFDTMSRAADSAIENALALTYVIATAHDALPKQSEDTGFWFASPLGPMVISGYIALAAEIVLAIVAGLLLMLCWARRRSAIRERAVGAFGIVLIFLASFLVAAVANQVAGIVSGKPTAAPQELLRQTAAWLTIAISISGLLAMVVNHWGFFIRGTRYHALASLVTLIIGVTLLALGAIELAWVPLLAAALFALAGYFLERGILCTLLTLAGIAVSTAPLLDPAFVREAIFHRFYPAGLPLPTYVGLVVFPSWLAAVGALRARLVSPSRGVSIALAVALFAAAAVAVTSLILPEPTCSELAWQTHGLSCELPELRE